MASDRKAVADKEAQAVDQLSLPGHDRDCARAILRQARGRGGISDIQVEHLLAIGHRAGVAHTTARFPDVAAEVLTAAGRTVPRLLLTRRRVGRWLHAMALTYRA